MEYGLIGEHLPHSFSKIIHDKIGLYEYELKEIAKDQLDAFMTARAFKGINVTIPYKQAVIPYLDEISERAEKIGAVNTIVNRNGKLIGDNTDFGGMEALFQKTGIRAAGKKVLVLGSGGTSRTALAVADSLGAAAIYRVSRSGRDGALTYEEAYESHSDAEIIINTTPCGMFPEIYDRPLDPDRFPHLSGVIDAIYNPLSTQLVLQAREQGARASGGLYMLVAQAVLAAGIFTGKEMPANQTDRIYGQLLRKKQNIVLIGMPGSGKTTVGKVLAKRLHRQLIDSDKVIVQEQAVTIPEIFAEKGESGFREIESGVIRRIAMETGCVIATGGGAILRKENLQALKANGVLVFLDREMQAIVPTDNRPLSDSEEKLKKLYEVRYPIYTAAADVHIKVTGNVYNAADDICLALYNNRMNRGRRPKQVRSGPGGKRR